MSSANLKSDLLMFGDLLAYLRQHGFHIGVDHYLRLQHLLDRIGDGCAPRELRTLLCPIFATSRAQQEQFYRAFDTYFDLFQALDEPLEEAASLNEAKQARARVVKANFSRRKWLYAVVPVALASLIFALVLFLRPRPAGQTASNQAQTEANTNAAPDAGGNTPAAAGTTGTESEATETPAQPSETQASKQIPTPLPTPQPSPERSFYERYRTWVNVAIILSPLVLFLLFEWYRFARRKLLLQKQHSRKPPYVWPIRVDPPEEGLYDSEQFLTAARLLRRRQVDEFRRLDVEATVAATIERLGFPDFRYRSDSRVPEYLILIDRASYKDHQARLFDELSQALEREGVFVVRYFFDGDPRVCRDEGGMVALQLTELQNRFSSHRLLIFGSGERLLDPISGRLDGWTTIFNHWQDRALLTVEPPARWGLREIALAQLFIVLPATLKGLLALVDYFETTMPEDLRAWVRGGPASPDSGATPEETMRSLRLTLGEDVFQWLAACAVYTELQWNLTLFIGSLPAMPAGLVTEENLLKLIRLPWFRTGTIPDELRWLLINELAPERQRAVRSALVELLERDPAPPETFASDQYRLNLFAQRWLESRTRKRLRELVQLMKQLPRSQIVRDLTLIRFLESSKRSPLDFLLPDRLRKTFYHRGVPAFGLKTGARFLVALVFIGIAWIGIKALAPPTVDDRALIARNFGDPKATPKNENPASMPTPEMTPQSPEAPAQDNPDEVVQESQGQNADQPGVRPSTVPSARPPQTAPSSAPSSPPVLLPVPSIIKEDPALFPTDIPLRSKPTDQSNEGRSGAVVTGVETGKGVGPERGTNVGGAGANSNANSQPEDYSRVFNAGEVTIKAKLNFVPKPSYTEEATQNKTAGSVLLQVVLSADGKVTNIKVIRGLPDGLTESALAAARRIKFTPAQKDGRLVSQYQNVEYKFNPPQNNRPPIDQRVPPQNPGRQPPGPRGRNP